MKRASGGHGPRTTATYSSSVPLILAFYSLAKEVEHAFVSYEYACAKHSMFITRRSS